MQLKILQNETQDEINDKEPTLKAEGENINQVWNLIEKLGAEQERKLIWDL